MFPATYFNAAIEIDFQREYERLKTAMQADQGRLRDRQLLRRALDHCAHDAYVAACLYIAAKKHLKMFKKIEHPQRVAALRKAALSHFESERARAIAGLAEGTPRPKAPTEQMVEDHMIHNLDEWAELERREIDLEAVMEALKTFAESWVSRCVDIRKMYETWQPPSNYMPDGGRQTDRDA